MKCLLSLVCTVALCASQAFALDPSKAAKPAEEPKASRPAAEDCLRKTIDSYSVSCTLSAALADWSTRSGVEVRVDWAALEEAGVTQKTAVAAGADKITWRQAMDLLMANVSRPGKPLGWRVLDGVAQVTTHQRLIAMRGQEQRAASRIGEAAAGEKTPARPEGMKMDFEGIALKDVLKFFQAAADVNFHVNWKALEAGGYSADTPVSLKVKGISVARAMDLVFDELGAGKDKFSSLYWVVDRGVVLISTGADLNRSWMTKVVDASSAMMVVPDFEGPRIRLDATAATSGTGTGATGTVGDQPIFREDARDSTRTAPKSLAEQQKERQEKIIGAIKAMVGEDMWEPNGKGSIKLLGNKLIITQSLLGFKLIEQALR